MIPAIWWHLMRYGWLYQHWVWAGAATADLIFRRGESFDGKLAVALLCLVLHRMRK